MDALATYFSMGGYGGFVWPSYALAALVMAGLVLTSWRGLRAREAELRALQDLMPGRRGRSHAGRKES